ncbi:MAG: biotin/lipoyl-containing protein [Caldisericia bacterium]
MDKKVNIEEKIRNLVALAKELGLSSLSVEDEEAEIYFELAGSTKITTQGSKETKVMERPNEEKDVSGNYVYAPFDGIFYSSPAPESPSFAVVGQKVDTGETLCIIEAMKVMNEIQAENGGIVKEVLKENGDQVLKGDPLFLIA